MAFNFHQLHIFYTVADKGSFSAAAQALYMTQPAVTMQIQALEDYFGNKMFLRSTKKIELTEAGRTLLPYALKSIELMKETESSMAKYTHMLQGRLHLGASLTMGEFILPQLLGPFGIQYPHISVSMNVMNTTQILDEIIHHQLNFGIVEAMIDHPDVQTDAIMSDELLLILPIKHELATEADISWADVVKYPFILRETGSGTRRVMEEELVRHGFDLGELKIIMELGSTGAIKAAVEANLGISILSQSAIKHELALGLLTTKNIKGIRFIRSFYTLYLRSTLLPLSALAFLNFFREHAEMKRSLLDENT
jgi:DNA-binding transcriptional LysR family regulator